MRDDFLTPTWADNRGQISANVHKFFDLIGESFERLHAYQFDAPWQRADAKRHPAPRV